jgi:outer membrane biosynthesis protein TonB
MTLATILLFSIFSTPSARPWEAPRHQTAPQSAPPSKPAETTPTQDPGATPPAQNPPTPSQPPTSAAPPATAPEKTSSGQTPPKITKKARHKKRVLPPNCSSAAATGDQTGAGSTPSTSASPAPSAGPAATNCPPSKVIVRQGGTSEPSIQLGGGAGDATSHQRDTANQMLAATEANLSKIAGQQLNSNQLDMVNQIRQFIKQSKAAVADGDLERARTLAWKAQLLSDELVKPPQ